MADSTRAKAAEELLKKNAKDIDEVKEDLKEGMGDIRQRQDSMEKKLDQLLQLATQNSSKEGTQANQVQEKLVINQFGSAYFVEDGSDGELGNLSSWMEIIGQANSEVVDVSVISPITLHMENHSEPLRTPNIISDELPTGADLDPSEIIIFPSDPDQSRHIEAAIISISSKYHIESPANPIEDMLMGEENTTTENYLVGSQSRMDQEIGEPRTLLEKSISSSCAPVGEKTSIASVVLLEEDQINKRLIEIASTRRLQLPLDNGSVLATDFEHMNCDSSIDEGDYYVFDPGKISNPQLSCIFSEIVIENESSCDDSGSIFENELAMLKDDNIIDGSVYLELMLKHDQVHYPRSKSGENYIFVN